MGERSQNRVLIVDDIKSNIDVLVQGLSEHYKLSIAVNGENALKSVQSKRPDLILLDIMMPGMDGFEVCRRLKADPETEDIPIIFVTAMDEAVNKTHCFELGAADYIVKPFEISEVRARIKTHLALKHSLSELNKTNEEQARNISELATIGKAMSSEPDLSRVLELILGLARRNTKADGGTLYLVTENRSELAFHVMHNETLNSYMGGASDEKVTLPNVLLYEDGEPNHANVCSYAALTNKTVNIPDVYEAEGFDFKGSHVFDEMMGYHAKSMLVVPMCDHENRMIGVLQLINAKDHNGESIPFGPDVIDLTEALAGQAAVMLTQQNLIDNLKDLFAVPHYGRGGYFRGLVRFGQTLQNGHAPFAGD
ncbi:MAG: response regulator [Proteobacteria bacterium]|nr:response regulator [Pseudomonadota bacterium]